jgi:hypothetical protein
VEVVLVVFEVVKDLVWLVRQREEAEDGTHLIDSHVLFQRGPEVPVPVVRVRFLNEVEQRLHVLEVRTGGRGVFLRANSWLGKKKKEQMERNAL